MKRIISIILVLMVCVGLMAGCGNSEETSGGASSNSGSSAGGVISTADVTFVTAEGDSVYRIVRPDGDTVTTSAAQFLFKQMKDKLGTNVRNVADTEDGTDVYEILIGETNREETAKAKAYLEEKTGARYDDYIICTIGKKIVIYSPNAETVNTAAKYFMENIVKAEGVKGGIEYIKAAEGNFEAITVNGVDVGKFDFVRPHYNSSYLTELEMQEIIETVYQKTGYMMEIDHDAYVEPQEYEIIVGNTTREGVETITNYDDFNITVKGTKVYINGGSAHATAMGVSEFGKMLTAGTITDASSVSSNYETALASYDKTTEFYKTWGDDFDGDALDQTKWRQETESNRTEGQNGKTSVRSSDPDRVFQSDGKFYICAGFDDNYYYGGMIRTQRTMNYKYGYLEMSALLPHGGGFWIALWACTTDSVNPITGDPKLLGPEIDIVEMFGNSASYAANCHSWPSALGKEMGIEHYSLDGKYSNAKRYTSVDEGVLLGDDFHTYGFLWDTTQMAFTCDGDLFFSYDITTNDLDIESYNQSLYLIFSMATAFASGSGTAADESAEEWHTTNKLVCDWINIYQKDDGLCQLNWFGAQ